MSTPHAPQREFALIRSIDPRSPDTWETKLFLTLDMDWVCDDVLAHTLDMLETAGAAATWFVSHETPLLERMAANPRFELGIHPNFNELLNGNTPQDGGQTAQKIIHGLKGILPGAVSARSHSMLQSSRILDALAYAGFVNDCNHFIPHEAGIPLRPWRHWAGGLVKVPYCWEDDVYVLGGMPHSVADLLARPGLIVVDFHPIHIALNTNDMAVYEETRPLHNDLEALRQHACKGFGIKTFFEELLAAVGCGE